MLLQILLSHAVEQVSMGMSGYGFFEEVNNYGK